MAISAWDSFARQDSPNGRFEAVFDRAIEIAMGGPTRGVLRIVEKKTGESVIEVSDANGAFVWASDSSALALPRWTRERKQQLVVVSMDTGRHKALDGEYRVLELNCFTDGFIAGVDSPVHRPVEIRVQVSR